MLYGFWTLVNQSVVAGHFKMIAGQVFVWFQSSFIGFKWLSLCYLWGGDEGMYISLSDQPSVWTKRLKEGETGMTNLV
jgi:hypothetical protein